MQGRTKEVMVNSKEGHNRIRPLHFLFPFFSLPNKFPPLLGISSLILFFFYLLFSPLGVSDHRVPPGALNPPICGISNFILFFFYLLFSPLGISHLRASPGALNPPTSRISESIQLLEVRLSLFQFSSHLGD